MKIFLLALLFYSSLYATNALREAQKLGAETDYATAIAKAQQENKILVMVTVREGCRWCDRLVQKTLTQRRVKQTLKNYVTLIIDKDSAYPNIFKEDLFPSIFYIDAKSQKSIYTRVGYVDRESLLNDLSEASQIQKDLFED